MAEEPIREDSERSVSGALTIVKVVMFLAVGMIFLGATTLLIAATFQMLRTLVAEVARFPEISPEQLRVAMIESVDIILVCTVLYIIAIGLYELFVDSRLRDRLPPWLRTFDISDLEGRLAGMVITVMAVIFLTQALEWHGDNILEFGLAMGAIIASISLFLYVEKRFAHPKSKESPSAETPPPDELL